MFCSVHVFQCKVLKWMTPTSLSCLDFFSYSDIFNGYLLLGPSTWFSKKLFLKKYFLMNKQYNKQQQKLTGNFLLFKNCLCLVKFMLKYGGHQSHGKSTYKQPEKK
jgi:hypothetical protein